MNGSDVKGIESHGCVGAGRVPHARMHACSECTPDDYEYLIGSAARAGMNFIRVWGGGGIEKQAFYDATDRWGILVYQVS